MFHNVNPIAEQVTKQKRSQTDSEAAFALIDLVAIVIISILLLMMFTTALAITRPNSHTFRCLNNLKQLGFAWRIYADDNQGKLPPNRDGGNVGKSAADAAWVGGWLDMNVGNTDNTNVRLLIDHQQYPYAAYLGPYVGTALLFRCPADESVVNVAVNRWVPRARSVSLNNHIGTLTRTWSTGSTYSLYSKISQFRSPSQVFVMLDERADSINDGLFWTYPENRYNLIDFPASYHDGAGNFSFADGHTETYRWSDPRTTPPITPGKLIALNVYIMGDPDVDWLQAHASERR